MYVAHLRCLALPQFLNEITGAAFNKLKEKYEI